MNKITDDEIIKALECCVKAENIGDCMILECPLMGDYGCEISGEEEKLFSLALGYINRLKAENERLNELVVYNASCATSLHKELFKAKSEAIKEFAERLKAVSHPYADTQMVFELQIDNLVKEMTGNEGKE
jgi:hypothetical protein